MAKLFSDIYFSGKTLFIFLLIFFSANTFCQETKTIQSVSGTVIDKTTRIPLAGANIVILKTSPQKGTTTDEKGFFRIENIPVGKIKIKISFVGYTTVILNNIILLSGKETVLNVELEKNPFELNEVTVVGRAMRFKQMSLYGGELKEEKNINGFYALEIFKDGNSDEVWGLEKTS
ncbi:MAG: carboxypeptidase-like regulatory domain-containing protein, partial [Bacteroidales bacterium]|nr:carboxypeptidase-like regulatory domain-containing protein [Bacteroidales bacterium]